MCEYCSVGTGWLVHTGNRIFGTKVCTQHLAKAITETSSRNNSNTNIIVEPVN